MLRNCASLPFRAGLLVTKELSSPALGPFGTESLTLRFIPYPLPPVTLDAERRPRDGRLDDVSVAALHGGRAALGWCSSRG